MVGGTLPDVFSTDRMDDPATNRGPITILPPERAPESWVPHSCEIAGRDVPCPTQRAGDVIATGTPPGVGQGVKPNPIFLKIGDTMRLSVEGLGVQTQRVVEG